MIKEKTYLKRLVTKCRLTYHSQDIQTFTVLNPGSSECYLLYNVCIFRQFLSLLLLLMILSCREQDNLLGDVSEDTSLIIGQSKNVVTVLKML